jgi:hypothetical protein
MMQCGSCRGSTGRERAACRRKTDMKDRPPSFELNRLVDRSDDAILSEIRRVAALVQAPYLSAVAFSEHAKVSRNTIRRRFGNWEEALRKAGLSHRVSPATKDLTDDEILESLRRLADELGRSELTFRLVNERLGIGFDRLKKSWGSSGAAFRAAGLSVSTGGQRYTDEECFENLLKVWTTLGRPPKIKEMNSTPSIVGGKAYIRRFGTWNRALQAFVERVNDVSSNADVAENEPMPNASVESRRMPLRDERGPRDAPLGLRFKVLSRDKFRCMLCGDNPPQNPNCILHVDHILPWSRGGATTEENLRTLCAHCNIGRSNRFVD